MAQMSKTFDFTYFYKDDDDLEKQLEKWRSFDLRRVVIGREKCPTTGRMHLQGKVTWARNYRLPQLSKLLPHYSLFPSVASKEFNYCMKEEILLNRNETKQGSRSDIHSAMAMVRDKRPRLELMETCPTVMARYERFLHSYKTELELHEGPRTVIWAYGKTGTGKTRAFWDVFPDGTPVDIKNDFFNGYGGEKIVILDDLRSSTLSFHDLLKITHRHRSNVNIKGGSIRWNAGLIYITSPRPPEETYTITGEDIEQLKRRVTHTFEFPRDLDECYRTLRGYLDSGEASEN